MNRPGFVVARNPSSTLGCLQAAIPDLFMISLRLSVKIATSLRFFHCAPPNILCIPPPYGGQMLVCFDSIDWGHVAANIVVGSKAALLNINTRCAATPCSAYSLTVRWCPTLFTVARTVLSRCWTWQRTPAKGCCGMSGRNSPEPVLVDSYAAWIQPVTAAYLADENSA